MDKRHSEFCYGSFTRVLPLPFGAEYDNGIRTVTIPIEEAAEGGRHVPVRRG